MRAFLFLVLVLQMMFEGVMLGSNQLQLQEIKLIRRAYLDVGGVVPTTEEVEWYVVYNDHGYEMAVEHLFNKHDTKLIREYVLSDAYKQQQPRRLDDVELHKSLLFVVGMLDGDEITSASIHQAKQRLIDQALLCCDNADDVMDYICNVLMSRCSNAQENNMLSHKFKQACDEMEESQAWMIMIEEIMNMPDVRYK